MFGNSLGVKIPPSNKKVRDHAKPLFVRVPMNTLRIFKRPQLASEAQVIDPELKTKGRFFATLSAFLALCNLIELGLEADYKCNIGRCEVEPQWELLTQIFTILPLAENGIRLAEAKPRRFFCGEKTKVKYKLDIVNLRSFGRETAFQYQLDFFSVFFGICSALLSI